MRTGLFSILLVALAATAAVSADRGSFMHDIDWTAAERHPQLPDGWVTPAQLETLSEVDLPVLLPDLPVMSEAKLTIGPGWYAASLQMADHTIFVQGTRVAFHDPSITADRAPEPGWEERAINRMDGIAEVNFTAFGAAYTVHVECAWLPLEDARCAEDAYIDMLGSALMLVETARYTTEVGR